VDIREEILRKRRAGKLPGDTTSLLKAWWQSHSKWPYPTVSLHITTNNHCFNLTITCLKFKNMCGPSSFSTLLFIVFCANHDEEIR